MIDRRKFLENSVLGAGGVLFSSTLLQSCTKFIPFPPINPDNGGNTPPPLPGLNIDWNEKAKIVVLAGLEMIPEAGEILGPLADIFWPATPEDVWGDVKAKTEALVKQQIAADVYGRVSATLGGLNGGLIDYINAVNQSEPGVKLTEWISTKKVFVVALPQFQQAGSELPLLGLFVQFANMYLGLLRDAVVSGKSWGRTDADHQQDIQNLKDAITHFTSYTNVWYESGRLELLINTPPDALKCEPFNTVNAYDREMALTMLDFKDTWKYYDVTQYPKGTKEVLTREIYSNPVGSYDISDKSTLVLPTPGAIKPPTQIQLWDQVTNFNVVQVAAAQLTYPAGSGPGGVTQTPLMGAQKLVGSGTVVNISPDNPVVEVDCVYAKYSVDYFALKFQDGSAVQVGNSIADPNRAGITTISYYSELMSSIYITGASGTTGYRGAACIVFGFQYWQSPSATLQAIQHLYVTSPKERSAADFAKAFPKLRIPAGLITYELKAARWAHWAYIKARAEEIR